MASYEFTGKSIQEAVRQAAQSLKVSENDFTWEVLEKPTKGFLGFGGKEGRIRVTLKEDSFDIQDIFKETEIQTATDGLSPTDPAELVRKAPDLDPPKTADLEPEAESDKASDDTILEVVEAPSYDVEAEEAPRESVVAEPVVEAKAPAASTEEAGLDPIEDVALRFLSPIFEALETQPVVRVVENEKEILFDIDGDHVGLLIGRRGETLRALQLLLSVVIHREVKTQKRILLDISNYNARRADSLEKLAARMADRARTTGRKVRLDPMNPAERRLVHLALEKEEGLTTYSEGKDPYRRIVIRPEDS